MSKGSSPRPLSVSKDEFADRWEATFGKSRFVDPEFQRLKNAKLRALLNNTHTAANPPVVIHPDGSHEFLKVKK